MKKCSMETIIVIFVVSEGFLPDFTGLMENFPATARFSNTSTKFETPNR